MPAINSSTRWILIGSFQFQPSEFGKIIIIFALARFISDYKDTFKDNQLIILSFIICLFPLLLIFKQPDYGTGLIYLLPILPMLYWSGVKFKILSLYIFPIISMLAAMNLLTYYIWMVFLFLFSYIINSDLLQLYLISL